MSAPSGKDELQAQAPESDGTTGARPATAESDRTAVHAGTTARWSSYEDFYGYSHDTDLDPGSLPVAVRHLPDQDVGTDVDEGRCTANLNRVVEDQTPTWGLGTGATKTKPHSDASTLVGNAQSEGSDVRTCGPEQPPHSPSLGTPTDGTGQGHRAPSPLTDGTGRGDTSPSSSQGRSTPARCRPISGHGDVYGPQRSGDTGPGSHLGRRRISFHAHGKRRRR